MGHSRGGASTKIHAVVDAYGYPIRLMISEGQKNDITYAIPLLELIDIEGSHVLADRGYDSNQLIDYIYDHGGEPRFHPWGGGQNLSAIVVGGFIKNGI